MESTSKKPRIAESEFLDFAEQGDMASLQALVEGSKVDNGERDSLINAVNKKGWTALHLAAAKGHASIVQWLVSDSGGRAAGFKSLLAKTEGGATALHLACRDGHLECVQALVEGSKIDNGEREALINAVSKGKLTSLHFASSKGHVSIVKWFLSDSGGRGAGFNVDLATMETGATALHLACRDGHLDCAEALVEGSKVYNGEREKLINAANEEGWTTLHYASFYGHPSIVRWLVSDSGGRAAGFSSLLATMETGATALHLACQGGHLACAEALVEGSKIDNGERESLLNAVDNEGRTSLHQASLLGHASIVEWLVSDSGGRAAGFNGLLAITISGTTALHAACEYGHLECVQALVEGSKIDNGEREKLINAVDKRGRTALHNASLYGHATIIRWLVSDSGGRAAGFNGLLAMTSSGTTALQIACHQGHLECVQALVEGSKIDNGEREALINAVEKQGMTALHHACYYGHTSIIRWLLSDTGGRAAGFNSLLVMTSSGMTALHLACHQAHLESVKALVEGSKIGNGEREALINAVSEKGFTALHAACFKGHVSIVRWLVSDSGGRAAGLQSSTITARTTDSESTLHLASRSGSIETMRALLSSCTATERINLFLRIDNHGWTALHSAIRHRRSQVIRELLLHHPETQLIVDVRDHRGMTALHRAVIDGIDDESRDEWVENRNLDDDEDRRAQVVGVLLFPGLSFNEIQRFINDEDNETNEKKEATREMLQAAVSKIDPNLGIKFE